MTSGLVSFILLLIMVTPAYADTIVTILTPENGTRVTDQTVWLVMSTPVDPKGMTVVLKNKDMVRRIKGKVIKKERTFVFHALLSLDAGLNEVTVGEKSLSIFYGPRYESAHTSRGNKEIAQKYVPYFFHRPQREARCSQCHSMDSITAGSEAVSQTNCIRCHAELTAVKYLHGPLGGGACLVCHDPASTPSKFAPKFEGKGELCFGCHQQRNVKQLEKMYFHGPVGADECTVCHDPHGSSSRRQLVKNKKTLCYLCHDKHRLIGGKVVHKAIKLHGCIVCHDPHSSNYTAHLLDAEKALCSKAECHPRFGKIEGDHPIVKHPIMGKRDPLRPEREFGCSSCHNPHSSDFHLLLPAEGYTLCAKCHKT